MPDACFEDYRLVRIYDSLDPIRDDLDAYVSIVGEFDVTSLLDIGCGTGTFACLLASLGVAVTAVDPATASLAIARQKAHAELVSWVEGDLSGLHPLSVDMAIMTGNVAQVFLSDEEWAEVLSAARHSLRPGGILVFETRDPSYEAWNEWTREKSFAWTEIAGVGRVESWVEVCNVDLPFVRFRQTYVFQESNERLTSDSTLRFRTKDEIGQSLKSSGFDLLSIRDAPDRPGREFVFIAQRAIDAP
jgi:SAM-dependent methyltransferase